GAAGMAAALSATVAERPQLVDRVEALRSRLIDGLQSDLDGVHESGVKGGDRSHKVAGSAHLCFEGIDSEALLFLLERGGVYASAASSCASGAQEPSHVLAAMGVTHELARGSLRLSLGATTSSADIDLALEVIPAAVRQLRGGS
ncbi:MAG: aminotransferase class V-fold PLP-dependent enzyme, partial [Acidimicrobiales bacterium]